MAVRPDPVSVVRFGVFEADLCSGELRKSGLKVKLADQPFQLLVMLLKRPGEVVTREELQKKLWSESTFVDFEHGVNKAVYRIREALGDDAENPHFVETLPRRGYRFMFPVGENGVRPNGAAMGTRRVPLRWRVTLAAGTLAAVIIVAALALNLAGLRERLFPQPLPRIESLAVLPLENLSGDPEQEYFADGMTEALISELGRIRALRLISRQSVMHFKGKDKTVPEIARELSVDAVVEGSVHRVDDRVRISAQLVQAKPERHLWAETFERDVRDILALESEVARAIADRIHIQISPREQLRLATSRPIHPAAYEAYLMGRYLWNKRTPAELKKALAYFERAANADPSHALAYVGMAETYNLLPGYGDMPVLEAYRKATKAALKALEIDETLGEAFIPLAQAKWRLGWDWSAEKEFREGLALSPNYATGHQWYGGYLTAMGRYAEGIEELRRAVGLDPLSLIINSDLAAEGHYFAGQYEQAVGQLQKVIELEPSFYYARLRLCEAYVELAQHQEALAECEKAAELSGRNSEVLASLGYAYAKVGRRGNARAVIKELEERAKSTRVPAYRLAVVYAGLELEEKALGQLDEGFREHSMGMEWMKTDPKLSSLRSKPRFQDLLQRMNFPD